MMKAQKAMVSMLVAAGRLAQALDDVCAGHGVTHDQYNVLRILRGAHPQGHPRFAIGERLMNRAPDVTRLLDRLARDGLVERSRSDEDRRLSISTVTPAGLELLRELDPEILAVHERFARRLKAKEVAEVARLCEKLLTD